MTQTEREIYNTIKIAGRLTVAQIAIEADFEEKQVRNAIASMTRREMIECVGSTYEGTGRVSGRQVLLYGVLPLHFPIPEISDPLTLLIYQMCRQSAQRA